MKFYRFIWLRTFHNPIVIRVSIRSGDRAEVVFKRGSGHAGYGIGKLISTKSREINNRQRLIDALLSSIDNADFWNLPSQEKTDEIVLDGAQWTFEAAEGNRYHVVSRWSPRRSRELWELGLTFCTVAGFRPYYDEVY